MLTNLRLFISAFVIFFLCTMYYVQGIIFLPEMAGPDATAHIDIAKFIAENDRLPVLPDDEAELHFSPGGTTRATRPPLSYALGGLATKVLPTGTVPHHAYSLGSAVLMAGTVVIIFLMVSFAFRRPIYGLLAAALAALMPQFTFIASYINDDSSAIFAGSLLIASILLLLLKKPLNSWCIAFVAAACGITIISKLSAWLLLPMVLIAALFQIKHLLANFLRYLLIFLPVFILFGAWWPIYNMLTYGFGDPLMFNIANELIQRHDLDLSDNNASGFAKLGLGYKELLFENYKGFIDNSYQSSIGYLDNLKLRLSPIQYGFYLPVIFIGLITFALRLVPRIMSKTNHDERRIGSSKDWLLIELLMISIVLFQLFMYTRFNLYQDIQVQGKYLLPTLPAILILFISGLDWLLKGIHRLVTLVPTWASRFVLFSRVTVIVLFCATVGMHLHALLIHVVPFYKLSPIQLNIWKFRPLPLSNDIYIKDIRNGTLKIEKRNWVFESETGGVFIVMSPKICGRFGLSTMMKIRLEADHKDFIRIFMNNGLGHIHKHSATLDYKAGDNALVYSLKKSHCEQLRLDIMSKPGKVIIKEISFAKVGFVPKFN